MRGEVGEASDARQQLFHAGRLPCLSSSLGCTQSRRRARSAPSSDWCCSGDPVAAVYLTVSSRHDFSQATRPAEQAPTCSPKPRESSDALKGWKPQAHPHHHMKSGGGRGEWRGDRGRAGKR